MQQTTVPYMPPAPESRVTAKKNVTGVVIASSVAVVILLASVAFNVVQRDDINSAKSTLRNTQGQLKATQGKLASSRSQLSSTTSTLLTTQSQLSDVQGRLKTVDGGFRVTNTCATALVSEWYNGTLLSMAQVVHGPYCQIVRNGNGI